MTVRPAFSRRCTTALLEGKNGAGWRLVRKTFPRLSPGNGTFLEVFGVVEVAVSHPSPRRVLPRPRRPPEIQRKVGLASLIRDALYGPSTRVSHVLQHRQQRCLYRVQLVLLCEINLRLKLLSRSRKITLNRTDCLQVARTYQRGLAGYRSNRGPWSCNGGTGLGQCALPRRKTPSEADPPPSSSQKMPGNHGPSQESRVPAPDVTNLRKPLTYPPS